MADVNKPKLQLRSGLSLNGDKTPSPATKLLINHGKPNFTIQRSPKALNGNANPMSPPPAAAAPAVVNSNTNNNNEFVVKSTTFNGVFKPSNISAATKQTLPQNGNSAASNGNDFEAAKVVLRRAKVVPAEAKEGEEDSNVPEFILRQRRIQERLANQNILDFENRRSGYFTQVMISPSSPNRQSFVETMASPAVKPGLEMPPPPSSPSQHEDIKEESSQEQQEEETQQQVEETQVEKIEEPAVTNEPITLNGQLEEEEVAKAIEEVNKAVEGEEEAKDEEEQMEETVTVEAEHKEETKPQEEQTQQEQHEQEVAPVEAAVPSAAVEEEPLAKEEETHEVAAAVVTSVLETAEEQVNGHVEAVATSAPLVEEVKEAMEPQTNGHVEEQTEQHLQNGHETNGHASENGITISHTNGLNGPSLPSPDPKGEKGVNFEPKTVVSFSQELGNDVNKYPDTVKVVKETETNTAAENELKELTKLKFEIKGDDKEDIEVKPVLITETA